MKSTIRPHYSTKAALVMMMASAAVYTAHVNAAPPYPTPDSTDAAHVASGTMTADPSKPEPAVIQQLADAQTKAAQLNGTLLAQHKAMSPAASPMPGMGAPAAAASPAAAMSPGGMKPGGMGDDKMMGMMSQMMGKMDKMMGMGGGMGGGAAPAAAAPMGGGMGMEDDDKMEMAGMMGMGSMGGAPAASMADSASPGSAGASHIYHIGATSFFLDHPQHITLTTDQQVGLNKIKDQAQLAKTASDRAIEQAEQELAVLTAADAPDMTKVDAKVRDIAKLAGDQRMAFIRSVGEAAKLLTADQRKVLTGFSPPAPAMAPAAPAASATPMPMTDM
jgi:Spy/CpxP family protein refolding chaperone